MGGLTLYETLRILVPGILTTVSLNFALQVGFGSKVFEADAGVKGFVGFLESTAGFTAFSLTAGLLLYMIDIPVKLRISRGGPDREHRIPSETLREMVKGSPLEKDALSLYFTLTDQYLPEEMRKRVYLFGSLYRIFVDMRVVLISVAVATMACSEVVARAGVATIPHTELDAVAGLSVVGIVAALVAIGGFGVRRHVLLSRAARLRDAGGDPENVAAARPGLWQQAWSDARGVIRPVLVLASAGGVAALLSASSDGIGTAVGLFAALCQLALWMMLEVGPPDDARSEKWRDRVLVALRARHKGFQYAAAQRLLFDLFLILPWLVGATWTNVVLDRDPAAVLAWSLLIVPPVVVMSFRKHEERLLGIYKEQTVWLEMHAKDIEGIRDSGLLPDRWEKSS